MKGAGTTMNMVARSVNDEYCPSWKRYAINPDVTIRLYWYQSIKTLAWLSKSCAKLKLKGIRHVPTAIENNEWGTTLGQNHTLLIAYHVTAQRNLAKQGYTDLTALVRSTQGMWTHLSKSITTSKIKRKGSTRTTLQQRYHLWWRTNIMMNGSRRRPWNPEQLVHERETSYSRRLTFKRILCPRYWST